MNTWPQGVKGWAQTGMFPPEHVRIEVTLHWEASTGSKRLGIEVTDHETDDYLAIKSVPLPAGATPNELALIVAGVLVDELGEHCLPF